MFIAEFQRRSRVGGTRSNRFHAAHGTILDETKEVLAINLTTIAEQEQTVRKPDITQLRAVLLIAAICGMMMWSGSKVRAQTLEWTQYLSATRWDRDEKSASGFGVSTDGLGSVYMTGYTGGSLGGPHAGSSDAFLSKYDADGNLSWVRQLGSSGQDEGQSVSADRLGNVFIAGENSGIVMPPIDEFDAYVAKYDASGNLDWVRQFGTAQEDWAYSVSADGLGNVYVTGSTQGSLAGPALGSTDEFLSKYDAEGNLAWARQLGTTASDSGRGVTADGLGNVYLAVSTGGHLGGPNAGSSDASLIKLDATGNILWTKQIGTVAADLARSVSTDGLGNIYMAGLTAGSLGGPNAGGLDVFVTKYDASGNLHWIQQLGTSADEGVGGGRVGVSADALGNVYLASDTTGSLGGPINGAGDPFVAKYDAAGNLHWIEQFGFGEAGEDAKGVAADGLGNVYVSGLSGCSLGGPHSVTCAMDGGYAYVAKFRDATVPEPRSGALTLVGWFLSYVHRIRRNRRPHFILVHGG